MRVRILYVFALLGMMVIAACAPPSTPTMGTAADETAIRAIGTAYTEAINKGDVAALGDLFADDYETVGPDGKIIKGRAEVTAGMKERAAAGAGSEPKLSVETTIFRWTSATTAAIGGTWSIAGLPPGTGSDKGAWSSTVAKGADGKWRMVTGLVAAYVPPTAPPAAPADKKPKKK
jgi:uncharacterized protein (TIGR02246 family)